MCSRSLVQTVWYLGTAGLGINGQIMTFLPTVNLQPNATYTLIVSNVFDLAGNMAVGQPYVATFATVDTLGPVVATIGIVSNLPPAAGATVPVQVTLAGNEPGASVRFSRQDFNPLGTGDQRAVYGARQVADHRQHHDQCDSD